MISTVRDVTERTRAERVQQDFIAMASHDLLTPETVLRAGLSYSSDVRPTTRSPQTTRIERMITDLRELVQDEGGQLTLRVAPVELSELARHAADRVRIQRTGHPLRIEFPDGPIVGQWDPDRLGQVRDNLLGSTPRPAARSSSGLPRQRGGASERYGSGTRYPWGVLPHLFKRFYGGEHHAGDAGLGLGLSIPRMLVEAHGGRIRVTAGPGTG